MSTPPNRKEKSSLFVLAMALPFPVLFLLAGAGSAASPRAASLPLLVVALFLAASRSGPPSSFSPRNPTFWRA